MAVATPVEVTSGTADVEAYTGTCRLFGYSFRENAGIAAAATVIIRDGTDATGTIVAVVELAADGSESVSFGPQGVWIQTGVYVDRVAGTTEGSLHIG